MKLRIAGITLLNGGDILFLAVCLLLGLIGLLL
jgi:hypothetical protein